MNQLGRLWDWLLPGLVSLSPMGAVAYYVAVVEEAALGDPATNVERRGLALDAPRTPVVIPLARA